MIIKPSSSNDPNPTQMDPIPFDLESPAPKPAAAADAGDRLFVEHDFLQLVSGKRNAPDEPAAAAATAADKKPKGEPLSLSLSLDSRSAPKRTTHSNNTTTQMTASDDLSFSLSCSYSLPFSHNPSCSLPQNTTTETPANPIWLAGEGTNGSVHSLFRPLGDGGGSVTFATPGLHPQLQQSETISFFPSELPVATSENEKRKTVMISRPDSVLIEIVSESVPLMSELLLEFNSDSLEAVRECLQNLMNAQEEKDEFCSLQKRLDRRSDLTAEILSKSHRAQLQVFVAIKTGVTNYLSEKDPTPNKELVEIFLLQRCRNVNCKNQLPVEDCDCNMCSTKKGFCSACTCPVCLQFDCSSNTCSWVGCDVCSHWCHAVCAIENDLIRPAPSLKGGPGKTEMQFHCIGCGHDSEMLGFVKEVFKCCAKDWSYEKLMQELGCVVKMFHQSEDFEGKELQRKAEEMQNMLARKCVSTLDACNGMLEFFKYGASDSSVTGNSSKNILTAQGNQREDTLRIPLPITTNPLRSAFNLEPMNFSLETQKVAIKTELMPLKSEQHFTLPNEDGIQSLETMVKLKEAEARLFQKLAGDARSEVEGYRQMIRAKSEKLEEEYATKLMNLCLQETDERKRKKLEELKFLENSHSVYNNIKMRMQVEIVSLNERTEVTGKQWV